MKQVSPQSVISTTTEQLQNALVQPVAKILGNDAVESVSLLCAKKSVADDLTKLVVKNHKGESSAVILCSPPAFPELTARYMRKSFTSQAVLAPELAHVVLTPLSEGYVNGLSYALFPYHQPLSNRKLQWYLQRFNLSSDLFKLLHRMTELSCVPATSTQIELNFLKPLAHLLELNSLPSNIHAAANQALLRLKDGAWQPCHVLMHGDLWKGNILLNQHIANGKKEWWNQFVLIDWSGSVLQGYGIYDLIRLSQSMKLTPSKLRDQLIAHCHILGCELTDTKAHLIATLGYLAMNLENFPFERFVAMAEECLITLEQACQSGRNNKAESIS